MKMQCHMHSLTDNKGRDSKMKKMLSICNMGMSGLPDNDVSVI